MVDDYADPLSVHNVEAADSLETPITFLESLEYLISIASTLPASLLIQVAGVLQKVDTPLNELLPISLVLSDSRLVQ